MRPPKPGPHPVPPPAAPAAPEVRRTAPPGTAPDRLGLLPGPGSSRPWTPEDLRGPRVRLDFGSTAEDALLIATLVGGFGSLAMLGTGFLVLGSRNARPADLHFFLGALLQAGLVIAPMAWIRWHLDETHVLDNEGDAIEHWQAVGARVRKRRVAPFDRIAWVAVRGCYHSCKHGSWWTYAPMLVLRDGTLIPLGDGFRREHGRAAESARVLARHLGVPCEPGAPEGTVVVTELRSDGPPRVGFVAWSDTEGCLPILVLLATIFAAVASGPFFGAMLGMLSRP